MNWLLIFIPIAAGLEAFAPQHDELIFVSSGLAILPLAAWMGHATEQLADRMGEAVGGLLNATFGNAAELIIALVALHAGLHDVVEASLIGSIIGNILLVLGASMLAGGLRHSEQRFNAAGASAEATMLTLAAIALVVPAVFEVVAGRPPENLRPLSFAISIVLLLVYFAFLAFSLVTHSKLFKSSAGEPEKAPAPTSTARAALVLAGATAAIAWMSELLVSTIESTTHELGLSKMFVGVFVVAILGNAAEHATAITAALKNRMELSLSIAIGSSIQVALFVAPLLIIASFFIGPSPMDLAFPVNLIVILMLSVLITGQVASDGRSDWLKGTQLLAVYVILGLTYLFLPEATSH